MDDRGRRQNDLYEDLDAVREYGKRFPDTWTGLMFDGDRLVALFTDPDAHRSGIAALVAHPDRVDVRAARRSEREVNEIVAAVAGRLESAAGRWFSFGPHLDTVHAALGGSAEDIARELHERFGDAVVLTVGAHEYPFADPPPPALTRPAPRSTLQVAGAELVAVPDSSVITTGEPITGQVEVTNTSTGDELAFDTDQPLRGELVDRDRIVSTLLSPVDGTGQGISLGPGAHTTIGFFAETDSLDLGHGATLPPGRYQLVVTVPITPWPAPYCGSSNWSRDRYRSTSSPTRALHADVLSAGSGQLAQAAAGAPHVGIGKLDRQPCRLHDQAWPTASKPSALGNVTVSSWPSFLSTGNTTACMSTSSDVVASRYVREAATGKGGTLRLRWVLAPLDR